MRMSENVSLSKAKADISNELTSNIRAGQTRTTRSRSDGTEMKIRKVSLGKRKIARRAERALHLDFETSSENPDKEPRLLGCARVDNQIAPPRYCLGSSTAIRSCGTPDEVGAS